MSYEMEKHYLLCSAKAISVGDRNFCGPLAFALLTDTTVEAARDYLGVPPREGMAGIKLLSAIERMGFKTTYIQGNNGRGMTRNMPNKLPRGTYLLFSNNHVAVMNDGVICDWSAEDDCVNKRIRQTYRIDKV